MTRKVMTIKSSGWSQNDAVLALSDPDSANQADATADGR